MSLAARLPRADGSMGATGVLGAAPQWLPGAIVAIVVAALGFFDGGYWPTSWGWAAVALGWAALLAVLLRREPPLDPLGLSFLGLLTAWLAWVAASAAWSPSRGATALEFERGLVYVAGVAAVLLLARRGDPMRLLVGTWAAVAAVSAYALAGKLRPGSLTRFDSISGFRLSEPLGYWNGLGVLCGLGMIAAIGVVAAAPNRAARLLAAASLPVLGTCLFFVYSRGAWLALLLGLVVLVVLDPLRLRTTCLVLVLASPTAAAIAAAAAANALNELGATAGEAADAGRRVALVVVLAAAASAALANVTRRLPSNLPTRFRGRGAWRIPLAAVLAVVACAVVAGGPGAIGERAQHAFAAAPPRLTPGDAAGERLFSLSGSARETQWHVAVDLFREHPLLGAGAGSFEGSWLRSRPVPEKVRDAHSLYLETLGELGLVGGSLLVAALAVPLVAGARARRHPAVPAALAVFVAYLAHAAVDWDWELPAVTLIALVCGTAVVVAARGAPRRCGPCRRGAAGAGLVCLGVLALVGLLGNSALSGGWAALERGAAGEARADADAARYWAPWSVEPLRLAAAADPLLGREAAAQQTLREAARAEPSNWNVWFDLAQLTVGAERRRALARAAELNPLSPELSTYLRANDLPLRKLPP